MSIGNRIKTLNKSATQKKASAYARSLIEASLDPLIIISAEGKITDLNNATEKATGYTHEELVGSAFSDYFTEPDKARAIYKLVYEKGFVTDYSLAICHKDGHVTDVLCNASVCRNQRGEVEGVLAAARDVTEQKKASKKHHARLEYISHYDVLTNLPNRTLLADRLSQDILKSERKHTVLAVAFLDLDNFKVVNDTYGHHVGDELLIIVSRRMEDALRKEDTLARIGGDEFIAVLANLEKTENYQPVLERLRLAVSKPITTGGIVFHLSVSIGVTLYSQDGAGADMLMRRADQAMYRAKQAGKNRYYLFDSACDDATNIQRESLDDISAALDRREFVLFYQPKVNMASGEVVGAEGLIRWQHPVRGLVPPLDFLPIVEDHAISLDVGEWVIDTALSQISQWRSIGISLPISVNISAYQLQHDNFVTRLTALLAAHPDVSPHDLELEVLETSALRDISQVSATMHACRELGVHFALDDFGTGYSPLTYFKRLPASAIKLDRHFVRDMLDDRYDLAIIEGVIHLAEAFEREVIAEGVETIEHGTALLQLGCKLAQGYCIAKPMPANDMPAWLNDWKPDDAWRIADVE